MSVLAHLAGGMGEPGATQALAYLLNRQAGLLRAFLNLPGIAGIQFDARPRVESEMGGDGGRPDMSIYDVNGNLRVLVENKFWAGLTDAQPVNYLKKRLPNDKSSGLLFIVPRQRVNMIWNELQVRCRDAGLDLGQGLLGGDRVKWVPTGAQRTMLVTDWENVLDVLEGAADGPEVRSDLFQFRRLIETLDAEAFLPLHSDEVTNVDVAKRVIGYVGLIDSICRRLDEEKIAGWGRSSSSTDPSVYRSLVLNSRDKDDWSALLLSFYLWRDSGGITPLWLWVNPAFHLPADFDHSDVQAPDNANKYIPIRLQLGVERERVIENAVEQIRRCCVRRLT